MFTIIGERINMTRKQIKEEVWNLNGEFIAGEAKCQVDAGATHIDVNAGGDPAREVEDMKWITGVVKDAVDIPLVFDSANPDVLRAGLELCNREGTIINSISGEKARLDSIIPLVKEFNTGVIALTMDDDGMPEDTEGRTRITGKLAGILQNEGISLSRVYFDHLVRPAATNPGQTRHVLAAIRWTREKYPEVHFAMGLSNVSFGIPKRNNLNRAFMAMIIEAGSDGAIVDPGEPGMINTICSARAALGIDEYCLEYLKAHRADRL